MPRLIWVYVRPTCHKVRFLTLWLKFFSFYAPNFKEVGGAYCFWVVRPSVRSSRFLMHSITLELWMLLFFKILIWIPHEKIAHTCIFFFFFFFFFFFCVCLFVCLFFVVVFFVLTGLCLFSELWPFEKIWMQSCQQNISKTIEARALKLGEKTGSDE